MRNVICIILIFVGVVMLGCQQNTKEKKDLNFKFAYFTDVHLGTEVGKQDTLLREAFRDAKSKGADFVIFGGDNFAADRYGIDDKEMIVDVYNRLLKLIEEEGLKVHHTVGNHDRYYFHKGEKSILGFDFYKETIHPELYYSFDYKGIHFIFMNGAELTDDGEYYAIREKQIEWLKNDLEKTGKETPIIVSTHVPLMSIYHLAMEGKASPYSTVINSKEVVDLLDPYNLKVVIQGHNHIYEEILVRDHWFVTGGATCGAWPSEVGYMLFEVDSKNSVSWDYLDFREKTNK